MKLALRPALAALLCILLAAPAAAMSSFAFVLLGEGSDGQPVAIARAVLEGASTCPALHRASGAVQAMTPRQRPQGSTFAAVLVCETLYPWDEAGSIAAPGLRHDLPRVSAATPRRILVVGDSGCNGAADRRPQDCSGAGLGRRWPFGLVADDGLRDHPDLIVHVGDYNYRGTPHGLVLPRHLTGYLEPLRVDVFDTGDLDDEDENPIFPIGPGYWSQNLPGSPRPDRWEDWRDDFFLPSARLLGAAAWVFTRGNHELCSRAGPGWFYLLDAASPLLGPGRTQNACPPQLPESWRAGAWPVRGEPFDGQSFPTQPTAPFRLRLGSLNLIVFDSSDAGDAQIYARDHYLEMYRRVARMLTDDPTPSWLVTHRPIWGVVRRAKGIPAGDAPYGFINLTQQLAVAAAFPNGFPAALVAVLSGHMHRFQATGFDGRRPPQIVVGTAGMELSTTHPAPAADDPKRPITVPSFDGLTGHVVGLSDFGALAVTLGDGGAWTGRLVGSSGDLLAVCDSRWPAPGSGRSVCALQ